jgi:threonine synthase
MRFVSTRGDAPPVSLAEALLRGPAPDGGLYMPETIPGTDAIALGPHANPGARGAAVLAPYCDGAIPRNDLEDLMADALNFELPVRHLDDDLDLLELFHGPTLAFKDVAARTMARLMARLRPHGQRLTVLVATSGDTGSAVAQAFWSVEGTQVVVLYPEGRVSPLQERQFATLGENVTAVSVDGAFDDCQALVRAAFADDDLRRRHCLTSANSINIGRLLPQAVFHLHGLAQLPPGAPPLVCVPSGNFGNLTAGLLAERMGGRVEGFLAATNANDVVPEFLETGEYHPRASVATVSNAMDVGAPSNFERIQWLLGRNAVDVGRRIRGARATDDTTRATIAEVHDRLGVVLDPHTAVGYRLLRDDLDRGPAGRRGLLLATAHPAKFREVVEPVIGRPVEIPERLARWADRPLQAHRISAELEQLAAILDS